MVIKVVYDESVDMYLPTHNSEGIFLDVEKIGSGCFGEVISAIDRRTEERRVVKQIKMKIKEGDVPSLHHLKDVLREVEISRRMEHPRIVKLTSVYMVQNATNSLLKYVCLIMENCGISLDSYVKNEYQTADKAIWLRDVVAVVIHDVASGLEYLKKCGIYHRDLTHKNVCVEKINTLIGAKIVDFGYARRKPDNSRSITHGICTPAYKSPENLLGAKYKDQNDVWSLGCIFGFLVSSDHLFAQYGKTPLESITDFIGMPSETFLNKISEAQLKDGLELKKLKKNVKVNSFAKRLAPKTVGYCQGTRRIDTLFIAYRGVTGMDDDAVADAIKLLKRMLQWDYDERIDVQGILQSEFLRPVIQRRLATTSEEPSNGDNCQSIKEELGEVERNIKSLVENDTISDSAKRRSPDRHDKGAVWLRE